MLLSQSDLRALSEARHKHPHDVLGMHQVTHAGKTGVAVRAFLPDAVAVSVVDESDSGEKPAAMKRLPDSDVFEVFIAGRKVFAYRLRVERRDGEVHEIHDPYSFLPTLSDQDLHLFNEGTDERVHEKMGAHLRRLGRVAGVSFAVWAPSARRVSVVGDFNAWDGRRHPMRPLGASGVWEIFLPGIGVGAKYKFELVGPRDDTPYLKTDPYGSHFESPPHNASIVCDVSGYAWGDEAWMKKRAKADLRREPVSVYEVHLGSWKLRHEDGDRPLTYAELGHELADYCVATGFTHVELMPPAEYPFAGSWGYQVTGFFAPTHRFGTPDDFCWFVDYLHGRGIGVILDWVPAHFPRDSFALAEFDGTHLYEHEDPRLGAHTEWGTLIFNYDRHEVRGFLVASALVWLERFHIDGLRVDAVSSMLYLNYARNDGEWLPNKDGGHENYGAIEFLRRVNDVIHRKFPGVVTIAEEATAFPGVTTPVEHGGLGFDFKWNMGWMHDTLSYMKNDPIHRKFAHNKITFAMLYQYTESFVLALSHDEVVHGKSSLINKLPQWDSAGKARNLRALFAYMWTWPGKKTLFMGCEFGQTSEWAYDRSLDWQLLQYPDHKGIQKIITDLNALYRADTGIAEAEQRPEGFEWVNADDGDNSVVSYLRRDAAAKVWWLVVGNFTPVKRDEYRVGVPFPGRWAEVLNSDAKEYGGAGIGNLGGVIAAPGSWNGRPHSVSVCLPGNSVVVFRFTVEA
jgi:1,4-alpha-glucan branching enzyme